MARRQRSWMTYVVAFAIALPAGGAGAAAARAAAPRPSAPHVASHPGHAGSRRARVRHHSTRPHRVARHTARPRANRHRALRHRAPRHRALRSHVPKRVGRHFVHHRTVRRRVVRATVGPLPLASSSACGDGDLIPTAASLGRVRAATLCLVNALRARRGTAPLRENGALAAAAQRHTDEMVARDYFAHIGPTGVDALGRARAAGYGAGRVALELGENIAYGTGALATAGATVTAWMNSPEHRANILNPAYLDTGIGVAAEAPSSLGRSRAGATYTQCFGSVR